MTRNDPVVIGSGECVGIGAIVHHLQDYRVRTGRVIETIPNWCGARRLFDRSYRGNTWVTLDRAKVRWIDWNGAPHSIVDAENLILAHDGECFSRIHYSSYPREWMEVKKILATRKKFGRSFRVVEREECDLPIRIKRSVVIDEFQRLARDRDVVDWVDRDGAEEGDVLVLEEGGIRFVLAVVKLDYAGEVLRAEDL